MAHHMSGLSTGRAVSLCALRSVKCQCVNAQAMCEHCRAPCSSLGGIHGIPRVHYKGRQGDYYVMVRLRLIAHLQMSSGCFE